LLAGSGAVGGGDGGGGGAPSGLGVGTRLSFRLVYPDLSFRGGGAGRLDGEFGVGRGRYVCREMGSVVIGASASEEQGAGEGKWEMGGEDAEKTLEDVRFVIGDFVDCAVFPPLSDGSVVGRGAVGGMGRGRENGFGGRGARGGGFGTAGRGRGEYRESIPSGEWRRGERLPDSGYRGGGGGGGYGGGRGRGRY
jgi:histone deacetylase complex subunit SAP18